MGLGFDSAARSSELDSVILLDPLGCSVILWLCELAGESMSPEVCQGVVE